MKPSKFRRSESGEAWAKGAELRERMVPLRHRVPRKEHETLSVYGDSGHCQRGTKVRGKPSVTPPKRPVEITTKKSVAIKIAI